MARLILVVYVFVSLGVVVSAQETRCVDRQSNAQACATDCRSDRGCPTCHRQKAPCCPKCDRPSVPESAERPESAPSDEHSGVFVAPPRTGTTVEESRSVAVRGFALHFPELKLGLPTLELPGLVRSRSGARMKIDSALAPFVATGVGMGAGAGGRSESAEKDSFEPESAETDPESAESGLKKKCEDLAKMKDDLSKAKQDLQSKVDELRRCLRELEESQPHQAPQPPPEPTQAPYIDPNVSHPAGRDLEPVYADLPEQPRMPAVRLLPLPSTVNAPAGEHERPVRQSSFVTRDEPRLPQATSKIRRLPPVNSGRATNVPVWYPTTR